MKISIVIVNYNVRYFLSTCLQSVERACIGLDAEVFVVDNDSTDQSVEMVREDFPWVKVIANDFNAGFSKANNQAIKESTGQYILLLNPDTVVEEDCFKKCIQYMDSHPDKGGMGVKMIDGSGRFLPESKRGLPTPSVAFYKIFGFSGLFPKSKRFGQYHLGYLDDEDISDVEVLSGAFMLMRKSVIDQIGGLDESFFMYGEDIDMSYRITEAGFKNVYFPDSEIIHFKGESTKKSSVNYVLVFYRAMIIFAKKHFSQKNARTFSLLINLAIYFRAALALLQRLFTRVYMPILDFAMMWLLLIVIKMNYELFVIGREGYFPEQLEIMAFPILGSSWVLGQLLLGGYHQPVKLKTVFKGLISSAVIIILVYAMLDEAYRFSRGIVAISILLAFLLFPISRIILDKWRLFQLIRFTEYNTAIVGSESSIERTRAILQSSAERKKNLLFIHPLPKSEINDEISLNFDGHLAQLNELIEIRKIDEVIFCLKDINVKSLIEVMQWKVMRKVNIYLEPPVGDFLLRSSSVHTLGEFILPESDPVMANSSIRKKRIFDVLLSIFLLIFSPFLFFLYRHPWSFMSNMGGILSGKLSFVGVQDSNLGKPYLVAFDKSLDETQSNNARINYLVNYGTEKDLEKVVAQLSSLDKEPFN